MPRPVYPVRPLCGGAGTVPRIHGMPTADDALVQPGRSGVRAQHRPSARPRLRTSRDPTTTVDVARSCPRTQAEGQSSASLRVTALAHLL